MSARHIFLSFAEEDLERVRLFRGQARNKNSALSFDDYSVKVPYNSTNAAYIKSRIIERIRASSVLVCLIGRQTHRSSWVDWEISKPTISARLSSASGSIRGEMTPPPLPWVTPGPGS